MTENQRLKEVQKLQKIKTQREFADILGIKQGSLSDIYREKEGVGVSNSIKRILENRYSINIHWLETGEGKMLKPIGLMNETEADKWENNPKVQHGEPLPASVGQSDEYCRLFDSYTSALRAIEAQKETIAIQKERISELKEQIKQGK